MGKEKFVEDVNGMDELNEAIKEALAKFEEEYGRKTETGDEFVTIFSNCALIISKKNDGLETNFICGKIFNASRTILLFEEDA